MSFVAIVTRSTDFGQLGVAHVLGPYEQRQQAQEDGQRVVDTMRALQLQGEDGDSLYIDVYPIAANYDALLSGVRNRTT